jgi:hypothetical protein
MDVQCGALYHNLRASFSIRVVAGLPQARWDERYWAET